MELKEALKRVALYLLVVAMLTAAFTLMYVVVSHRFDPVYVVASLFLAIFLSLFIFDVDINPYGGDLPY